MPPVCNFLPSGFGCLASARRCSGGSVVSWIKHHVGAEFKIRTSSRSSSSPLSDGWALLLQGMSALKCSPPCCLRERRRFRHCSPFSPRGWQIMPESFWCSVALDTSLPHSLHHLLMGKWGWPGSGPSFPILVAGGVLTVVQDSCDKDRAMGMHPGMLCSVSPSPGQFMVTGRPQPPVGAALGSAKQT